MTKRSFLIVVWALSIIMLKTQCGMAQFSIDLETGAGFVTQNDASSSWKNSNGELNGTDGTQYSYKTDFKNPAKPVIRFRASYGFGRTKRHLISFLAAPLQYKAKGSFQQPVTFNSQVFAPGVETEGYYQFNGYRLTYRFLIKNTEKLRLGVGLTLNLRDAEFSLKQGSLYERNYNRGVVPLLNTYLKYHLGGHVYGLVDGDIFYIDNSGGAIDYLGGLQYDLNGKAGIKLGYRVFSGVGSEKGNVYNKLLAQSIIVGGVFQF
ncbi:MAG: hypothetical protein WCR52_14205 [Bacteroidota bacterium]